VRAAAVRHSEASARAMAQLENAGVRAPATLRGFDEWFRRHKAILEKDALLIAYGRIGRRRGALSAYPPVFEELPGGWELRIRRLHIAFSPDLLEALELDRLPVTISGHALERMFQRINTIDWPVIRNCLASAVQFINAVGGAFALAKYSQCAVLAEKGLLVGRVEDEGVLSLKTFLPESQLGQKWQVLYEDLGAFAAERREAFDNAMLVPDEGLEDDFRRMLEVGNYGWLRRPYVKGEDPLEDAWHSRAESDDDSAYESAALRS